MARKATDQVTKRGVNIGKSSFHLIGLDGRLGSPAEVLCMLPERPLSDLQADLPRGPCAAIGA